MSHVWRALIFLILSSSSLHAETPRGLHLDGVVTDIVFVDTLHFQCWVPAGDLAFGIARDDNVLYEKLGGRPWAPVVEFAFEGIKIDAIVDYTANRNCLRLLGHNLWNGRNVIIARFYHKTERGWNTVNSYTWIEESAEPADLWVALRVQRRDAG